VWFDEGPLGAAGAMDMASKRSTWRDLLERGAEKLSEGKYQEAVRWFEAAYAQAPHEPLVCYALGRERMRQRRYDESEVLLRRAWEDDRSLLSAGLSLVRLLGLHLGKDEEARQILDAMREDAESAGDEELVALVEGELDLRRGERAEHAIEVFRSLMESGRAGVAARDGLARAYNVKGIRLARSGRAHEALFVLKQATDLVEDWAPPMVNMGVVFQTMGKVRRAKKEYLRALVVEPDSPTALFNLGKLAMRQEELNQASAYFRQLLERHPSYPGVRSVLAELTRRKRALLNKAPK